MNADEIAGYVVAAAAAQGLDLDAGQLERVTAVFARNADIARLVLEFGLPESVEAAPVFHP
ncbi:MAG TPA: DUF4089 domain-containing protein [Burkholderiales bacterium]|nr:DUF4089 domain-containing protein [Burkholderiales bacterium]